MAGVSERRDYKGKDIITEKLQANISELKARLFVAKQSTEDKGDDTKNFERANADHIHRTKNQNGNRLLNSKAGRQKTTEQYFQDAGRKQFSIWNSILSQTIRLCEHYIEGA